MRGPLFFQRLTLRPFDRLRAGSFDGFMVTTALSVNPEQTPPGKAGQWFDRLTTLSESKGRGIDRRFRRVLASVPCLNARPGALLTD